jgi:hypothetical protein
MNVVLSTTGMSHSLNSMPMSRSIHGNAASWPMARITSSQGMTTVSIFSWWSLPASSSVDRKTSNSMPTSRPPPGRRRVGEWFSTISTPSSSASSSSHSGLALK